MCPGVSTRMQSPASSSPPPQADAVPSVDVDTTDLSDAGALPPIDPSLISTNETAAETFQFAFSFDRVVEGNAIPITITGMTIVFLGLLSISLMIAFLPKLLKILDRRLAPRRPRGSSPSTTSAHAKIEASSGPGTIPEHLPPETAAAVALVVHMELTRIRGQSRITIDESRRQNVWGVVGKMRRLSTRM